MACVLKKVKQRWHLQRRLHTIQDFEWMHWLFINVRPFSDPQKWKFCLFTFLPRWKWASFLRMSSDKKIRHFIIKPQGGMVTHMSIVFQVQMVCILLANIFKPLLKMCCRDERERSNFVVRCLADVAVSSFWFWHSANLSKYRFSGSKCHWNDILTD